MRTCLHVAFKQRQKALIVFLPVIDGGEIHSLCLLVKSLIEHQSFCVMRSASVENSTSSPKPKTTIHTTGECQPHSLHCYQELGMRDL